MNIPIMELLMKQSKNPMSVSEAGRKGGKSTSPKKLKAIARNLKLAHKAKRNRLTNISMDEALKLKKEYGESVTIVPPVPEV